VKEDLSRQIHKRADAERLARSLKTSLAEEKAERSRAETELVALRGDFARAKADVSACVRILLEAGLAVPPYLGRWNHGPVDGASNVVDEYPSQMVKADEQALVAQINGSPSTHGMESKPSSLRSRRSVLTLGGETEPPKTPTPLASNSTESEINIAAEGNHIQAYLDSQDLDRSSLFSERMVEDSNFSDADVVDMDVALEYSRQSTRFSIVSSCVTELTEALERLPPLGTLPPPPTTFLPSNNYAPSHASPLKSSTFTGDKAQQLRDVPKRSESVSKRTFAAKKRAPTNNALSVAPDGIPPPIPSKDPPGTSLLINCPPRYTSMPQTNSIPTTVVTPPEGPPSKSETIRKSISAKGSTFDHNKERPPKLQLTGQEKHFRLWGPRSPGLSFPSGLKSDKPTPISHRRRSHDSISRPSELPLSASEPPSLTPLSQISPNGKTSPLADAQGRAKKGSKFTFAGGLSHALSKIKDVMTGEDVEPVPPSARRRKLSAPPPDTTPVEPKMHVFQPTFFSKIVKCMACGHRIWGVAATRDMACKTCGYIAHAKCCPLVPPNCMGRLMSATNPVPPTSAIPWSLFGVELEVHARKTGVLVPKVVEACIAVVESQGMDMEGIYRKSGPVAAIRQAVAEFDQGKEPDTGDDRGFGDVTVASSVLKQYFRELPNPLITKNVYPLVKSAIRLDAIAPAVKSNSTPTLSRIKEEADSETYSKESLLKSKITAMRNALSQLPLAHRATLSVLFAHLRRVVDQSAINRMPERNLGVVFGPTVVRDPNQMESYDLVSIDVVEFLLAYYQLIFPLPEPQLFPSVTRADVKLAPRLSLALEPTYATDLSQYCLEPVPQLPVPKGSDKSLNEDSGKEGR
jgi:hypothetical protein